MRFPWLRAKSRDADLADEIRSHLAMAIAERVARGESRADAEQAARREFGNVGLVTEVTREQWGAVWIERLLQDLRYAARSLRRAPGFATVAILTLALGIGVNTAMFTVVNGVLLRPLPFPRSDRLMFPSYKQANNPFVRGPSLSDGNYIKLKGRTQAFAQIATFSNEQVALTGAGDPVRLEAASVTPELIGILGVAPAIGSGFAPGDGKAGGPAVVLLGDQLWRERFSADAGIVGKLVTIDGVAHTVIGVMPPRFDFPNRSAIWRPTEVVVSPGNQWSRPVIGRLREGATREQALAELKAISLELDDFPGAKRAEMVAEVVSAKQFVVGDVKQPLWILAGAVGFVLLIACANVANLLLMRAATREQEIAVRAALGAERPRLIRQLLTESTALAALGGALGVVLALAGVRALVLLAPEGRIPRIGELRLDAGVLAFTAGLSLLTGILFGLVPAMRATRRELRQSIAQGARSIVAGHARLRGALVVTEIALALVLLAGAGLMLRSFAHMRAVKLGFSPANVVAMTVDLPRSTYKDAASMQRFDRAVHDGLAALPGVESAGAVNFRPLGAGLITGSFTPEGAARNSDGSHWAQKIVASPGYFATWGIRLRDGREFSNDDQGTAPQVVIVSASLARRLWPNESAVGKRLTTADKPAAADWMAVVGVVDDVMQESVRGEVGAAIYRPYAQTTFPFSLGRMTFAVRTRLPLATVAPAMRGVVRRVDKDMPVQSVATMEALVASTMDEPRFQARLLALFSVLALLLASIGIYGILAYSVAERTREIGVRVALGAQRGDVSRMVLRRTLALALPGVVLGVAGALAVTRVLEKLLFGVKPNDAATLVAVAALFAAVAVLAALVPARRAARVDPIIALRME